MNNEEIEKMELKYTNAIRERIENAMKCEIGLDAVLTIGYRMIKLQDRIDKAIEHLHKRYEQNNSALTNKEETIISKHELLKLENINNKILEDILRGKDNEQNRS